MAQVVYKDFYCLVVCKDIYYIIYGSGGLQGFLLLSWFTQISIEISIAKVVLHCFLLLRWFYTEFYCSGGLK